MPPSPVTGRTIQSSPSRWAQTAPPCSPRAAEPQGQASGAQPQTMATVATSPAAKSLRSQR
eukprot:42751-Eustigmatos_ZCMA.PRE.1